jgi:hypothetical protein
MYCALVVLGDLQMNCVDCQSWLPSMPLEILPDIATSRPIPWLSYILSEGYYISENLVWIWEPPWSLQPRQSIRFRVQRQLTLTPTWGDVSGLFSHELTNFSDANGVVCISEILWNDELAQFCIQGVQHLHFIGTGLQIVEECVLLSIPLQGLRLSGFSLESFQEARQQKCGGVGKLAWLKWIFLVLRYSSDNAVSGVDFQIYATNIISFSSHTMTVGNLLSKQPWPPLVLLNTIIIMRLVSWPSFCYHHIAAYYKVLYHPLTNGWTTIKWMKWRAD